MVALKATWELDQPADNNSNACDDLHVTHRQDTLHMIVTTRFKGWLYVLLKFAYLDKCFLKPFLSLVAFVPYTKRPLPPSSKKPKYEFIHKIRIELRLAVRSPSGIVTFLKRISIWLIYDKIMDKNDEDDNTRSCDIANSSLNLVDGSAHDMKKVGSAHPNPCNITVRVNFIRLKVAVNIAIRHGASVT